MPYDKCMAKSPDKELTDQADQTQSDQTRTDSNAPPPADKTLHKQVTQVAKPEDRPGTATDVDKTIADGDENAAVDNTALDHYDVDTMATDVTMVRPAGDKSKTMGPADVTLNKPIHQQETLVGPPSNIHTAQTVGAESEEQSTPGSRPFGDYELLSMIAKGGMGVVYRARQRKLNRIVAMKMILAGQFADDVDVKRFYGEAEAAAKLRHPNIVGIHEVGECDGQHFFSMEFIDGQSLSALVRENPLPPTQAAMLVKDIALAMQYAHEHDVLHRDLKPSNVLLDESQRPMITDFGLAKQVEGQSQLTMSGAIVGTPSYMPPEQASAQTEKVGVCSDVYSTGAILYELITGSPPFRAATPFETIRQVLERDPISPRVLDSSIPVDLETICLKCLQKEPAARYASSNELADELTRFINGEPIHARPIGPIHRLWRRCQRNPVVASLSVLAIVLSIAFVANLIASNITTKRLLAKSDQALQETLKTVNSLFVIISEERLLNEPGAKQLREELLMKAQEIYERLHSRESDDPQILHELALSHYRVGRILAELRSPAEAKKSYQRAMRMMAQLVEANPGELQYLLELSDAQNFLGVLEGGPLEEPSIGLKWFEEVKSHRATLVKEAPKNFEYRRKLASVHMSCGLMHKKLGDDKAAKQEFEHAQKLRTELRKELTDVVDLTKSESTEQKVLVRVHRDLADGFHNLGLLANRELQESLEIVHDAGRKIRKENSGDSEELKNNIARAKEHVANAIKLRKQHIDHYDKAVRSLSDALRVVPGDLENQFRMAVYRRAFGDAKNTDIIEVTPKKNKDGQHLVIEHVLSDWKDVKEQFVASQEILQRLVDRNPKVHEYRYALAGLQLPLGRLYCDMEQVKTGLATYEKSINNLERLLAIKGMEKVAKYRFDLAVGKKNLAYQQTISVEQLQLNAKLADWEKPLRLLAQARDLMSELNAAHPKIRQYKRELEKVNFDRFDVAKVLTKTGIGKAIALSKSKDATDQQWTAAEAWLQRAKAIFDELEKTYASDQRLLEELSKGSKGYQKAKAYFDGLRK